MSEKIDATITVPNRNGLHARPAAMFVQTANRFSSDITVTLDKFPANGKSILELMTLAAPYGSQLHLTVEGDDARELLDAIMDLVKRNFDDPV